MSKQSGRILKTVHTTKTILSQKVDGGAFLFVDVEYRVQNVGDTDVDTYEVYFRIQTGGVDFYYEAQGDSLAVAQTDVAQFSKYLRDRSANSVAVDDYWVP